MAWSRIIRQQESLVLYKSFHTLWSPSMDRCARPRPEPTPLSRFCFTNEVFVPHSNPTPPYSTPPHLFFYTPLFSGPTVTHIICLTLVNHKQNQSIKMPGKRQIFSIPVDKYMGHPFFIPCASPTENRFMSYIYKQRYLPM